MVFCGKPSKGCTQCRGRRIKVFIHVYCDWNETANDREKCDLLEPSCTQCIRANKSCAGYRDQLALKFRDESAKVVRKVRISDTPSPPTVTSGRGSPAKGQAGGNSAQIVALVWPWEASSASSSPPTQATSVVSTPEEPKAIDWLRARIPPSSIPSPLLPHVNDSDQGISFFFQHYVTTIPHDQMVTKFWPHLFTHKAFFDAVSAVGLAGLANVRGDGELMGVARRKYGKGVKKVAASLGVLAREREKEGAGDGRGKRVMEDTMKEVMMLAVFEVS